MWTVIGLGNPGTEYEKTRHNVGRMLVERFAHAQDFSEWKFDKKSNAQTATGNVGKHKVRLMLPDTFMNKSGAAAKSVVTNATQAEQLVVIYDDLDLPFGVLRLAYGRGSGGHRGVDSLIKNLKTKNFVRLRVGISPTTPSGKMKKPLGEQQVLTFIMNTFTPKEEAVLKKLSKKVQEALITLVEEGRNKAMTEFNQ